MYILGRQMLKIKMSILAGQGLKIYILAGQGLKIKMHISLQDKGLK